MPYIDVFNIVAPMIQVYMSLRFQLQACTLLSIPAVPLNGTRKCGVALMTNCTANARSVGGAPAPDT